MAAVHFGHIYDDECFAFDPFDADLRAERVIQQAGTLRGQILLQLVRGGYALGAIDGVALGIDRPVGTQQQPAAAHAGFVGKGDHRFEYRLADLPRPLRLDTRRLVAGVEFFEQALGAIRSMRLPLDTQKAGW